MHKVVLPAHGALLAAVGSLGQGLVLERDGVLFAVGAVNVEDKRVKGREVPGGQVVDSALGCEAGTAQGLDVEVARELGPRGRADVVGPEDSQVGL